MGRVVEWDNPNIWSKEIAVHRAFHLGFLGTSPETLLKLAGPSVTINQIVDYLYHGKAVNVGLGYKGIETELPDELEISNYNAVAKVLGTVSWEMIMYGIQ